MAKASTALCPFSKNALAASNELLFVHLLVRANFHLWFRNCKGVPIKHSWTSSLWHRPASGCKDAALSPARRSTLTRSLKSSELQRQDGDPIMVLARLAPHPLRPRHLQSRVQRTYPTRRWLNLELGIRKPYSVVGINVVVFPVIQHII